MLVACPENSLLDSREFLVPIVTPFECLLALGNKEWTGYYDLDLTCVSNQIRNAEITPLNEPYFSLITGTLQGQSMQDEPIIGQEVINQDSQVSRIYGTNSAFESFKKRTFQGLDRETQSSIQSKVFIARSGIASGYSHELKN